MANAVDRIEEVLKDLSVELGVDEDSDEFRAAVAQLAKYTARQFGVFEIAAKPRRAVLTAQRVREMRELYTNEDMTQSQLVERFGVTASTVSRILSGKMWGHVE